jgi:hypothetical protein
LFRRLDERAAIRNQVLAQNIHQAAVILLFGKDLIQ